ncbi:MAG: MATE family efflux transporter [Ezakiella sp.]|uniref:MATE family efflux transporter n=1 Tax=Ezakiella sp. TaxID=1935205 RepID=UPI0029780521|nr:MATE family efflux transporter [Ezakiella sp.]MDD7731702.1 MATE family efflux transporter [Eubacteriales bacterium]MDY6080145.1 MATE family efflux transporter [Ezakiella sp.]
MNSKKVVNMLEGPLLGPIFLFAMPLFITSVLQLAFNAVDIIVVGKFTGHHALAAVGATGPVINLLVTMFMGISLGASVIMGKNVGARDFKNAQDTLHTAIGISILGGILVLFAGIFTAMPLLRLMQTPPEVIELAGEYLKIYYIGMPGFMVYNFGSALLRAIGDSRRPMYFLTISGIFNVICNLIFVIVFKMGVAGVAIATSISQYIAAALTVASLLKADGYMKLSFDKIRISKDKALGMMKIGLPAGFQGALFSISNILIQSGINSFGSVVMAGNTAAGNLEGFVYMGMNAVYQTSLSFTSQNMGAKQYDRVKKIFWTCVRVVIVVGLVLGVGAWIFGDKLLRLYTDEPEVIKYGVERLGVVSATYFLCGIMDTMVGGLRGMGYSITPMIIGLTAVCILRMIWIATIFQSIHTPVVLYLSYPLSWTVAAIGNYVNYLYAMKKLDKMKAEEATA